MKELIRTLTECFGPSGHEAGVRELIRGALPRGSETRVDAMGNLIVHRAGTGGGRRIMLAAHMDEIGIVVTHVDAKGFLRFGSVGGVLSMPLTGGRVRFAKGITGVIGLEKLEDSSRVPPLEKFYIDVGAPGPRTAPCWSVTWRASTGTARTWAARMVAKAMDDRIGCAALLQTMKELARSPHDLYFVFTVQEEVGLRGAGTSGYRSGARDRARRGRHSHGRHPGMRPDGGGAGRRPGRQDQGRRHARAPGSKRVAAAHRRGRGHPLPARGARPRARRTQARSRCPGPGCRPAASRSPPGTCTLPPRLWTTETWKRS